MMPWALNEQDIAMNDWELRRIEAQLERLDEQLRDQRDQTRESDTKTYIWLMIISSILFVLVMSHIAQKRDGEAQGAHPSKQLREAI